MSGPRGQDEIVKTIILKDGKSEREASSRRCRKSGFQHTNRKQADNSLTSMGPCVARFPGKDCLFRGLPTSSFACQVHSPLSFAANTRGGCYSAGTGPTPWAGHWQEAEADRGRSALPGVHVSQGSSAQLTHRHTHTQTQGSRGAVKCQVWGFHWKAMARPAGVRQNLRGSRRMPSPGVSCTCVLRTSAGSGLVSRPASPHMPPACLCSTWPSASFVPTDAAVFSFPTPPSPAH